MLSVIIPTLNEEIHLKELLGKLRPQMADQDEIIVIDSYSKDKTPEIAESHGARLVQKEKRGVGIARTEGAKAAKNDVLVFLDADCIPSHDFTKRIKKHFADKSVVAVGGLDLYHSDSRMWRVIYNTYSKGIFHSAKITHKLTGKYWVPANNCAIRKDVFFKVGGYRSVICEDMDLMRRAPATRHVVYDHDLVLTLSDRRFTQHGFFRTVALWGWSNLAAWVGDGVDVMGGYTKE